MIRFVPKRDDDNSYKDKAFNRDQKNACALDSRVPQLVTAPSMRAIEKVGWKTFLSCYLDRWTWPTYLPLDLHGEFQVCTSVHSDTHTYYVRTTKLQCPLVHMYLCAHCTSIALLLQISTSMDLQVSWIRRWLTNWIVWMSLQRHSPAMTVHNFSQYVNVTFNYSYLIALSNVAKCI